MTDQLHFIRHACTLMRPISGRYSDIATDGAIRLLARHGAAGVTLQGLADEFNMTPQGVRRWFGSTDVMWERIAATFGARWAAWVGERRRVPYVPLGEPRIDLPPLSLLLPLNAEEIAATRAWLAMCQCARDNEALATIIDHWEAEELQAMHRVAEWDGVTLDDASMRVVAALVRGLRHEVSRTCSPMPISDAHEILASALATLGATAPAAVHSFE